VVLLDVRVVRKMLDTVDGTLSSETEIAGPREELAGGVMRGTQISKEQTRRPWMRSDAINRKKSGKRRPRDNAKLSCYGSIVRDLRRVGASYLGKHVSCCPPARGRKGRAKELRGGA
jgi:hypothetical protein